MANKEKEKGLLAAMIRVACWPYPASGDPDEIIPVIKEKPKDRGGDR